MSSNGSKNFNTLLSISCIVLLLLALGFHPLQLTLADSVTGKTAWPELVGVPGCAADEYIRNENSSIRTIVVPHDARVPLKYVYNASVVFVPIQGVHGVVSNIPRTG